MLLSHLDAVVGRGCVANTLFMMPDKTELNRNNQKAQLSDLRPGVRVIVDVPEGSNDKITHSVKVGTAAATDHDAHK